VLALLAACGPSHDPVQDADASEGDTTSSSSTTAHEGTGAGTTVESDTDGSHEDDSTGQPPAEPFPFDVDLKWRVTRDPIPDETFAGQVVVLGDVDGDGREDLAVTGYTVDGPRVFVVFGKDDLRDVRVEDIERGLGGFVIRGAGSRIARAGDVDGDGLADVLAQAWNRDPSSTYVVFGKADGAAVSVEDVAAGQGGYVVTGSAGFVDGGHDADGDGRADFLVRHAQRDPAEHFVVFGTDQTAPIVLADAVADGQAVRIVGGTGWLRFIGDFDGDGHDDLAIEDRFHEVDDAIVGVLLVVFGRDEPQSLSLTEVAAGDTDLGTMIFAVASSFGVERAELLAGLGDLDGDGIDDLAVSGGGFGDVLLVRGSADRAPVQLEDSHPRVLGRIIPATDFGPPAAVALGDLDGDGRGDIALTQGEYPRDAPRLGIVFPDGCVDVMLSRPAPVSSWPFHRIACGPFLGGSLAAGDLTPRSDVSLLATDSGQALVYGFAPR
jgi:hypothetical protein